MCDVPAWHHVVKQGTGYDPGLNYLCNSNLMLRPYIKIISETRLKNSSIESSGLCRRNPWKGGRIAIVSWMSVYVLCRWKCLVHCWEHNEMLIFLLLLHLITHPTKCYTNSKVHAPSEKTTLNKCVFKCFAKVSGPTDRSLIYYYYWMSLLSCHMSNEFNCNSPTISQGG